MGRGPNKHFKYMYRVHELPWHFAKSLKDISEKVNYSNDHVKKIFKNKIKNKKNLEIYIIQ